MTSTIQKLRREIIKHVMRVNWKVENEMKNFSLDYTFYRKKSDDHMQYLWKFFIFLCILDDYHQKYLHQSLLVVFFLEQSLYSTLLSIFDDCITISFTLDYFSHQHFKRFVTHTVLTLYVSLSSQLLKMLWNYFLKCIY